MHRLFRSGFRANCPLYRLAWPVGTSIRTLHSRVPPYAPPGRPGMAVYRAQNRREIAHRCQLVPTRDKGAQGVLRGPAAAAGQRRMHLRPWERVSRPASWHAIGCRAGLPRASPRGSCEQIMHYKVAIQRSSACCVQQPVAAAEPPPQTRPPRPWGRRHHHIQRLPIHGTDPPSCCSGSGPAECRSWRAVGQPSS